MNPSEPLRVIGIDPGSIKCGLGIVERRGNKLVRIHSETIQCGRGDLNDRLVVVYEAIKAACDAHSPNRAAIEGIFHHRNADSALKLGHARGVAMLALKHAGMSALEMQPTEIKKSIGTTGRADKSQVRSMVMYLLNMDQQPGLDESDALAIAIAGCHRKDLAALSGNSGAGAARTGASRRRKR